MNLLPVRAPAGLKYDEDQEGYVMDGQPVMRVSDMLEHYPKQWMGWWVAGETAKALGVFKALDGDAKTAWKRATYTKEGAGWEEGVAYTAKGIIQKVTEARKAFNRKSKEALVTGDLAHKWIAEHLKGNDLPLPADEGAKYAIAGFMLWVKEWDVHFLASEMRLYHSQYKYAGTADCVVSLRAQRDSEGTDAPGLPASRLTGARQGDGMVLGIGDYKTSAELRDTNVLQLDAYLAALCDMYITHQEPIPEMGRFLVRLPKKKDDSYEMKWITSDHEVGFGTVLALLGVKKWMEYIEAHNKESK